MCKEGGGEVRRPVGVALSIHQVKDVLPRLLEIGRVIRPRVGVAGQIGSKDLTQLLNLPILYGFLP